MRRPGARMGGRGRGSEKPGDPGSQEAVVDAAAGLEITARKLKEDVEFATRRPSKCLNPSPWLDPQIIFLYVLRGI